MAERQEGGAPRHEVLITRPSGEAPATASRVAALGYRPVLAPLMLVRGRPVTWPPASDAVLVTSGNAVPGLQGSGARRVLAVGDATAERVRAAGIAGVESAGGDAADLVALVRDRCPPGALLVLLTGAGQGGALAGSLRGAGYRVVRRVAYAATPVRAMPPPALAALEGGALRAALFLSAETAAAFVRLFPPRLTPSLAGIEALAIGRRAADALAPLPWRRVRVSVGPSLDQVLALL